MKTVLVLGAGASLNYGYPTGLELRNKILRLGKTPEAHASEMMIPTNDLLDFTRAFHESQMYSIDAFLARRMEFSETGKLAIGKVLLECELEARLFEEGTEDHWYQYLVNVLARPDWDDFRPSWLAIVTFNYDRSLEQYLRRSLQAIYGQTEPKILARLEALPIIHVYGDLGPLSQKEGGFRYGETANKSGRIRTAAERLRVIAEGRDDEPHLDTCRSLLAEADQICFLGFGFDQINLRRIGAPKVFLLPTNGTPKRIAATTIGLTKSEVHRSAIRVMDNGGGHPAAVENFMAKNCIGLLRETLILG